MILIGHANILTAFNDATVGTRVDDAGAFSAYLLGAVAAYDFASQRVPGQGFVSLPFDAAVTVTAGVGKRTEDPADYVIRSWRGSVGLYLKRDCAAPVESVAAVVYTAEAYLADPEVAKNADEVARVRDAGLTHILVAVLASAGPRPPLSPGRFVSNLAGGNKEALVWSADEIRAKAAEIVAYDAAWAVVAD